MSDNRLLISITKTGPSSFTVRFPEKLEDPTIECYIDLLTEGGHKVTSVCQYSHHWEDGKAMTIPSEAYALARKLAAVIHRAADEKIINVAAMLDTAKSPI